MKLKKTTFIIICAFIFMLALTSCSTDSMQSTDSFVRDATRNAGNAMNGGANNSQGGRGGATAGADGGYSANSAAGRSSMTGMNGSSQNGSQNNGTDFLPSLNDGSRDNYGQVNTTNGKSDGGMGDMYRDTDTRRNSLHVDTFK